MSEQALKPWRSVVDHDSRESHVHPISNLIEHDVEQGARDRCICGPRVGCIITDNGDYWEYVHHSLDGREASE